jgi:hypothetical protein
MSHYETYELAKARHADLIAERTRWAAAQAARRRKHRAGWPRVAVSRALHRLAERIEPTTSTPRKLVMPAQRRLHRA